MCDASQSAVAEFNAIITSTFAQVLLEPQAIVFGLGYEAPGAKLSLVLMFVQLIVELFLDVLVDNTAMWAEAEHGIPITRWFNEIRNPLVFVIHTAASVITLAVALFGFLRHPQVVVPTFSSFLPSSSLSPAHSLSLSELR